MATKGKLKKVNQRDLKFKKIKLLTKCILNPNINSSIIEEDKIEFDSSLKYRMFNHVLIYPKILKYVNTYLNNIYMFNKYTPKRWIQTFAVILRTLDISKLYYPKFKVSDRDNFFKIIQDYFNTINSKKLNLNELNCIYSLYNNKAISNFKLNQIKNISSGQEKVGGTTAKAKFDKIVEPTKVNENGIVNSYIDEVKKYIKTRSPCKKCKLLGQKNLIIRTNLENPSGNIDFAIITFSPTKEEISSGELYNHQHAQTFHKMLEEACGRSDLTYVYTNAILCETPVEEKASKLKTEAKICKGVTSSILDNQFNPTFKIIIGSEAKIAYGITTAMKNCHRKVVNDNCIVIPSPEEVIASPKRKLPILEESLLFIAESINNAKGKEQTKKKDIEIPEEKRMRRIEKGWVLWDTQIINNEFILYTYTNHETMEKRYDKREVEYPIYLKHGIFKDCDYITDQVDDVILVNAHEKAELSKQLGWNTRNLIKNVG
ncbi:MAG: hypothetical protein H8D97_00305 [Proteobacteria bacterium]|nr:hypothetical protein [Pseudomonadota bacterium]